MIAMSTTIRSEPGRSRREALMVAREARRLVGFERSYNCPRCGFEHRAWAPLRSCPACAQRLDVAVIRRAAFA